MFFLAQARSDLAGIFLDSGYQWNYLCSSSFTYRLLSRKTIS
ncbi:hypothetical protein LEP1GSC088_0004 [Leptospira interrogans str. L1207]|nr:hypothetical protein LEP1GSC088_0004 [Leptospira interrogans str. L1207]